MILDDLKKIKKLDSKGMIESIEHIYRQCQQAVEEVRKIKIPRSYAVASDIIVFGVGGSALGPRVAQTLFADSLKLPIEIVRDYSLPAYLGKNSLVILSSYSGNTEEVLIAAQEVSRRTKKIMAITSGGQLKNLARRKKWPVYLIDPVYNPCGQPRMAIGYSIMGIVKLLEKTGLIKLSDQEVKKMISYVAGLNSRFGLKVKKNNLAKKTALELHNKIPIFIASEHLVGNANVAANQINENGKNLAMFFTIPEINHHLLEGLSFPKQSKKSFYFIFLNSRFYHPRTQLRYKITMDILKKRGYEFTEIKLTGPTKLIQSFETLSLTSYLGFYLAMLNKIDPSPIPWVDYLKKAIGSDPP
ncbi:MAG TPA: bifunctional phosphoglucose/phosphomannose isomerase [Patescibacteria group bacterium]